MRVFRTTYKTKDGESKQASKWYVEFRDHLDTVRRLPAFTDKRQSEELGRKIEKLVACRANGESPDKQLGRWLEALPDKTRQRLAKIGVLDAQNIAAGKPLSEHLDDFHAYLMAKGNTEKHVNHTVGRARCIIEGCRFRYWSNISPSKVQSYLAELHDVSDGIGIETLNHYLQAVKQFAKWMVMDGRVSQSPIDHLQAQNARTDRRHDRRALSVDELLWLIGTTHNSAEQFQASGPERVVLYRLAVETGLRANELRSLTRASFDLKAAPPTVTVDAAYSKRRRQDVLPLRPDTAELMKAHLANKMPGAKALAMPNADRMARMMRADLEAARQAWLAEAPTETERARREASSFLVYRDDSGQVADFHALRHTFITNLARGGVSPKQAQMLARHSKISLTMDRYTHTVIGEQSEALDALPDLSQPFRQQAQATGTEGRSQNNENLALYLARNGAEESDSVRRGAMKWTPEEPSPTAPKPLKNKGEHSKTSARPLAPPVGLEPTTYGLTVRRSTN